MPRMTAEQALEGIRARIAGEWDNPCLKAMGPLGDKDGDIQRLLEMPEIAPEVEKDLDPDTVFIINYNRDYDETMLSFPTRASAVQQIATDFEYEGDAELDSAEFWSEIGELYNQGNWKGLNVCELDTRTCSIKPIDRPEYCASLKP